MVSLAAMRASNSQVATALPSGLVAVFIGATSGIGEYSLKQFAKHASRPRAYFVGRSQEAGDRILAECKALNPKGEYIFRKGDVSLIRVVDDICREIKSKEKAINILCVSQGNMVSYTSKSQLSTVGRAEWLTMKSAETTEDLHMMTSLIHYSRIRFIVNLLPLIQKATSLRRVINIFTAGKEGPIYTDDIQAWKVPIRSIMGHGSSLATISLEALAKKAPDVSFIHGFPGHVKTNLARGGQGPMVFVLAQVFKFTSLFHQSRFIPSVECGERHVFLMTSAKYPAGMPVEGTSGIALADGLEAARGTDGQLGSGVYSVDENGESYGFKTEDVMAKLRKEGAMEKVWNDLETKWKRITGLAAA
jgi:NAD(P)-dependent dehydrogenase (short-subunit alcohol dehydrogenase family)